jgi:hypothetical protein
MKRRVFQVDTEIMEKMVLWAHRLISLQVATTCQNTNGPRSLISLGILDPRL